MTFGKPNRPGVGHILLVAQAFKGTLTVREVAAAMEKGASHTGFTTDTVLGADGGDGFVQILDTEPDLERQIPVTGPMGQTISCSVSWLDRKTAVIESRLVCGLSLVAEKARDPSKATTRGVGEMVLAAQEMGAEVVLIGLGGSATMDGGTGMASAWGWKFEDENGAKLENGGGSLNKLARVTPGQKPQVELLAIADVTNPLVGPLGARVYARQKGADVASEVALDRGLARLAQILGEDGPDGLASQEGAGAAGGLGFGLLAFGGGALHRGADWVLQRAHFEDRLKGATAVLVAEAEFDRTSLMGKLSGQVLRAAAEARVPAGLVAPSAREVPEGVIVEAGGGFWDAQELARRTGVLVGKLVRLPGE